MVNFLSDQYLSRARDCSVSALEGRGTAVRFPSVERDICLLRKVRKIAGFVPAVSYLMDAEIISPISEATGCRTQHSHVVPSLRMSGTTPP
jgi:hypothetical protein